MLLSIIIPVYNMQRYLERCINSVLNRNTDEIEIILVDDGSTDDSPCICDTYVDQYENIKVIHKKNDGLSSARNTGIRNSSGEYLAFLDSDDMFEKSFTEDILKYIKYYNADIFTFRYCLEREYNIYQCYGTRNVTIYDKYGYLEKVMDNTWSCQIWVRVFKRELFDNCLFPLNCHYEDMRILWKLLLSVSGKIADIDYTYYIYNLTNPNSITKLADIKNMKDMKDAVDIMTEGIFNEYRKEGMLTEKVKEYLLYYKMNIYIYIAYKLRYLKNDKTGTKEELINYIVSHKINLLKYGNYDWKKYLVCKALIKIEKSNFIM